MKKNNLYIGMVYILIGVFLLITAIVSETKLDSLLWGMGGGAFGSGITMICRYVYWSRPKNRAVYEERLAKEAIEMHDELKEKLRDKSGRYAYVLGLAVVCVSILVISVLGSFDFIGNNRLILLYLSGYLVFQIAAGIIIFNHLLKKY